MNWNNDEKRVWTKRDWLIWAVIVLLATLLSVAILSIPVRGQGSDPVPTMSSTRWAAPVVYLPEVRNER
jgi:ABC-type phosphate/phosphonate transport system permease subunit